MAKITPVLWKTHKTKQREHPIYLRIEAGNRRLYTSLKLYVKPRFWNADQAEVRKTHSHAKEFNDIIGMHKLAAEKAELRLRLEGEVVTPKAIKKALQPPRPADTDFCVFGREYAEELRKRGQIPTSRRYFSVMRKFEAFKGGRVLFTDLSNKLLRDYETYMKEKLGNGPSTVASNFRTLRTLINRARKEGLLTDRQDLMDGITIKETPSEKRKLTTKEIDALRSAKLDPNTPRWHARNYWLFSLFIGGMRFRDVANLLVENVREGRLTYQMSKTGAYRNLDLPPVALDIIGHYVSDTSSAEDFVFPLLKGRNVNTPEMHDRSVQSMNAYTNRLLKEIAAIANVYPGLSFHQSRHSFANMALADGWSVRKIQAALGCQRRASTTG